VEIRTALLEILAEVDQLIEENDAACALERRIVDATDQHHFDSPKTGAQRNLERLEAIALDLVSHRAAIVEYLDKVYGAYPETSADAREAEE
jgi:hypothetical protein